LKLPDCEILAFDMDGVLVEVSESYRETICRTVQHFTGRTITRELVQEYKNKGGFNNDWLLSQTIAADLGVTVAFDTVVDYFNSIFFGNTVDGVPDGLMAREQWIAKPGVLEKLASRYHLCVFTGREHEEAMMTIRRFSNGVKFDPVLGADQVANAKPAPDGLIKLQDMFPDGEMWYVGDTVDDARCARLAGVPFFGIAAPTVSHRERLLELFEQENAMTVLESINQLPEVLNL